MFGLFKKKVKIEPVDREMCEQKIKKAWELSSMTLNNATGEWHLKTGDFESALGWCFDAGQSATRCNEFPEHLRTYWGGHFIARTALLNSSQGQYNQAIEQYRGVAQALEQHVESHMTACDPLIEASTTALTDGVYYTAAECRMYAAGVAIISDETDDSAAMALEQYSKAGELAMDTEIYSPSKRLYVVHGVTLGLAAMSWKEINNEVFDIITRYAGDTINYTTAALDMGTSLEGAMVELPLLAELVDLYALLLSIHSDEAMNSLKQRVDDSGVPTPWRDAEHSSYQTTALTLGREVH